MINFSCKAESSYDISEGPNSFDHPIKCDVLSCIPKSKKCEISTSTLCNTEAMSKTVMSYQSLSSDLSGSEQGKDDNKTAIKEKKYIRTKLTSVVENEKEAGLSLRRDVINKTVLRMFRRYFSHSFKDMFPKKFKSKESKKKWYFNAIKEFCSKTFGANHEKLNEIQFYMASVINPKGMTQQNIEETGLPMEQFEMFHDCLYKYSHTKFVNLLKIETLGTIYEYFYNGPLEDLLRSEPSACKNYSAYSVALTEFYQVSLGFHTTNFMVYVFVLHLICQFSMKFYQSITTQI